MTQRLSNERNKERSTLWYRKSYLQLTSCVQNFPEQKTSVTAINEISFDIGKGEILGLVGESGCGKSVTSLSIMRLLNFTSGKVTKGEVIFDGKDLQKLSEKEMREIRGGKMSMIFQEPMSSLNPAMRIDKQMIEGIRLHTNLSKQEARERAAKILQQVGIPDPERVLKNYPHQLSGGMSQRVMIAMAMSCNPQLLIADEQPPLWTLPFRHRFWN